jgi:hypothetical protein
VRLDLPVKQVQPVKLVHRVLLEEMVPLPILVLLALKENVVFKARLDDHSMLKGFSMKLVNF